MKRFLLHIILFTIWASFCLFGCVCGNNTSSEQLMVVDICNYFRQENIDSSLGIVSFVNSDTCLQLAQEQNGDYHCDFLKDKIIMYHPDDYNIVFMLCEPPTPSNELYVYIDSARYLVQPKQPYAIYSLNEFLPKFIYLNLFPGDTLLDNDQVVCVQDECLYEILEVRDKYLLVREVLYSETATPRIISQSSKPIYLYPWRNGYSLKTKRFAIDE